MKKITTIITSLLIILALEVSAQTKDTVNFGKPMTDSLWKTMPDSIRLKSYNYITSPYFTLSSANDTVAVIAYCQIKGTHFKWRKMYGVAIAGNNIVVENTLYVVPALPRSRP